MLWMNEPVRVERRWPMWRGFAMFGEEYSIERGGRVWGERRRVGVMRVFAIGVRWEVLRGWVVGWVEGWRIVICGVEFLNDRV